MSKSLTCFTTYVSGTSGYNIWSNGYCEQWGVATHPKFSANTGSSNTITFVKTFVNSSYNFTITMKTDAGNTVGLRSQSVSPSANKIQVNWWTTSQLNNTGTYYWRACGYLADNQY